MTAAARDVEKELVRSRSALAEIVRESGVGGLVARGSDDLWACCPFHNEDSASFHVRARLGLYKCFGCGASGDVFSFVQQIRGVDFKEALRFLAERAGITLGSLSAEDRQAAAAARRLRDVLEVALTQFQQAIRSPGNAARAYVAGRGFSDDTLARFDVGFVPDDFRQRLLRAGLPPADIDSAGFTGAFAGRVSFGIRDAHGGLVGFGARTLGADAMPKYVNTRETPAFNKRSLLYGLDKAARHAMRSGRLVIMEGYTDVMMAHQAGLHETVASMGTSFTAEHAAAIPASIRNLVLLFDGDQAGADAAMRATRLLLQRGRESRVLSLPDGQDPCDWFSTRNGAAFEALLAQAGSTAVTFLCEGELARIDPGQPGRREAAARAVMEICRGVTEPIRREGIAHEIAAACGLDRNLVRKSVGARPADRSTDGSAAVLPLHAAVRCQFALLAGLVEGGPSAAAVSRYVADGVVDHRDVLALVALAGDPPVDPLAWIARASGAEERLGRLLDAALNPPPGCPLPDRAEAEAHLRSRLAERAAREARQQAFARPGIEACPDQLAALATSLKSAHEIAARRGAPSNPSPVPGSSPVHPAEAPSP